MFYESSKGFEFAPKIEDEIKRHENMRKNNICAYNCNQHSSERFATGYLLP